MAARSFSSSTPESLAATLRSWPDEALTRLVRERDDLMIPTPTSFDDLAERARTVLSLSRALDRIDAFTLRVLDGLRLVAVDRVADVASLSTVTTDMSGVEKSIQRLRDMAIVWGPSDRLRFPSSVTEAYGPYPAGLGRAAAEISDAAARLVADPASLRRAVMAAPPQARAVLERLAEGPPIGTYTGDIDRVESPVGWLVDRGLLAPVDDDTVELPSEVGRLLRRDDGPLGKLPREPVPAGERLRPSDVDASGAAQVLESIRLTEDLLAMLAVDPIPSVKSGGVGNQGLQRLAKNAGISAAQAAAFLETAYAAGLLGSANRWLPAHPFDAWRARPAEERWTRLARAWLDAPRDARLVGQRGAGGRSATVLSPDLTSLSAPRFRRLALELLAEYPPGTPVTPDEAASILNWRAPRRRVEDGVRAALAQASALGIIARGAITTVGRRLLDTLVDDPLGVERDGDPIEQALRDILPPPIEDVIVQGDLTVIVPGHPSPLLASELGMLTDAESPTTYRVSVMSLRRAMDAGYSSDDIMAVFARRSTTPLPQALEYLVADVWRRHGGLRIGDVGSYLRGDDPAAVAAVLADRRLTTAHLRRLADTVLVSPLSTAELVDLLRRAGHAPVAEDAAGAVVVDRSEAARAVAVARPESPPDPTPRLTEPALAAAVERLRVDDEQAGASPPRPADDLLETLRQALPKRRLVWVEYEVGDDTVRKLLRPVSIHAGYLRAEDRRTEMLNTIALHTIRSVTIASV